MTTVNDIRARFSTYPSFAYRDVELYLRGRKKRDGNIARVLSYMKTSGMIYQIRKGAYTFSRDDVVSGFAYSPFYYGLRSALTMRELWTQNSRPEIMTLRKVRASRSHIFSDPNATIFLHHVPLKYFFGFGTVQYGRWRVPVSDPEKTLIDLLHYKVRLPIQEYGPLLGAVDTRKLQRYLGAYGKATRSAVSGFMEGNLRAARSGKLSRPY